MNAQIQDLAKQAKEAVPAGLVVDKWIECYNEKFAELIVQECCEQIRICSEQIKNDEVYADDNLWPIFQSIVDAVELDVKEHFGIE